jgi:hypothetical protein
MQDKILFFLATFPLVSDAAVRERLECRDGERLIVGFKRAGQLIGYMSVTGTAVTGYYRLRELVPAAAKEVRDLRSFRFNGGLGDCSVDVGVLGQRNSGRWICDGRPYVGTCQIKR